MRARGGYFFSEHPVSVSSLRLSEAIVLGSVKHPQKFGGFLDSDAHGVTATCGIVAALDAIGIIDSAVNAKETICADKVFPILRHKVSGCPECKKLHHHDEWLFPVTLDTVAAVIMHLNDDHRWSRPQQAEWVRQIEESVQLEAQELPCTQEVVEEVQLTREVKG